MDRKSLIGLSLIGLILVTWQIFFMPKTPPKTTQKSTTDTTLAVTATAQESISDKSTNAADEAANDSLKSSLAASQFGPFAPFADGVEQFYTLENKLIRVTLSTLGGAVVKVELKDFLRFGGDTLTLFDLGESKFNYTYFADNKIINTSALYFVTTANKSQIAASGNDTARISFRIPVDNNAFLEHSYALSGDGYRLNHSIKKVGLQDILSNNINYTQLTWEMKTPRQERILKEERQNSTMFYKYLNDDADKISYTDNKVEDLKNQIKWVSFKQKFFSAVLVAENSFDEGKVASHEYPTEEYVKNMSAALNIPLNHQSNEQFNAFFYFGPNHYQTLKKFSLDLEKQIPLGWGIFGWVNRFLVIPIFNFLDSFALNYGLIILILTLIIKLILSPFTYKSYLSTAKMKVLKPEMEEIKAKYADDMQRQQQEQMKLFQKAGVSPLGGCLPLLFQLPILIALFNFFPASIELRQQAFLWATDLSTYDSIWDFGYVPIINTIYGDHVSLFTLLMTISTLIYTRMNNEISGVTGQMKVISYIMPVMFLGILNNYSAGLSYYYFLANMITFGQQFLIRRLVNEDKIHAQIQENKKKPVKKSAFAAKIEEMAKAQQAKAQQRKK